MSNSLAIKYINCDAIFKFGGAWVQIKGVVDI